MLQLSRIHKLKHISLVDLCFVSAVLVNSEWIFAGRAAQTKNLCLGGRRQPSPVRRRSIQWANCNAGDIWFLWHDTNLYRRQCSRSEDTG